ncbi:hypothetical protein [Streptomyces sp. NPDC052107]|uniref:hypothetical protein n=1 Tax=Streptomyces sp. NPDC052107 TaxID=3155632 RepID=UPI00341F1613
MAEALLVDMSLPVSDGAVIATISKRDGKNRATEKTSVRGVFTDACACHHFLSWVCRLGGGWRDVGAEHQRLLDRILEDQHRKLAPEKGRDDFFTFFAADKALQDWDLDNDEITDGIVDGAHDCGIDGIWTFVDERYITADAHQFLPSRAGKIELVILQAKNTCASPLCGISLASTSTTSTMT